MRMKKIIKLKAAGSILISFLIVFGCLALWKEKINKTDGTYTLCIYMCGSDLETKRGAASKNIDELLAAHLPENVQIILQTGGFALSAIFTKSKLLSSAIARALDIGTIPS